MSNTTSRFDIALSAYPLNYLKGLRERQIPVRKPLGKSLLRNFSLNDPNRYLPAHVIYGFFAQIRKQYGHEFFSSRYLNHFKFQNMGVTGKFLVSNNRVLPALQDMVKYGRLLCTNQDIQLDIKGTNAFCSNRFSSDLGFERNTMEHIWLLMLLDLLKSAEGASWSPAEIHLTGKENEYPRLEMVPDATIISFNMERTGLRFKTSTLAKRLGKGKRLEVTEEILQQPAKNLSEKIEILLDNNYTANLPSLMIISEFFGVSVSTLKRHLATEHINYQGILERWRFMKGVRLLTETSLKIKEISDCLYYANSANFVRAFRRWSGKTPSDFRLAD